MLDEALLLIYGTAAAAILIAIVAYYYMPTLVGATQAQAEYAALRDAAPTLILARDGKSVHVCINSTAPQRVLVQRSGVWVDAQKDCRINPGGQCVSGDHQSWPFCRWYLGAYRPGDDITIVLKTDRASIVKSYRIAAVAPSVRLRAPGNVADSLNATGGQNGTYVVVITMTGTVYSTTTVTVTTTVTYYNTTTVTVTAPTTVTATHTVIIYDPSFTTTRTLMACIPDTTTSPTPTFPPIEVGRYGFQPLSATTSTVTSYTTIYTTSYVTSTVTTTVWTTSTLTYTPTVTTTITSLRPGVVVTCYVCRTPTPTTTCSTTTLVTTTSTTTITGEPSLAQSNTSSRGLSIDAFFFGLSAVAMMVGSVMLAKKR
jgi:hypothetical protein